MKKRLFVLIAVVLLMSVMLVACNDEHKTDVIPTPTVAETQEPSSPTPTERPTPTEKPTPTEVPYWTIGTPTPMPTEFPEYTEQEKNDYINGFKADTVLTVSETKNELGLDAFGVEWDPHFWRSYNLLSMDDDFNVSTVGEQDWALIAERARELGIQKIRIMTLPGWYEPKNDNDDPFVTDFDAFAFESEHFNSIYRELLVAEQLGIDVNLTFWGADYETTSWMAFNGVNDWITAPKDPDEYAENVCALLKYLFDEKGLTCIKEITVHNEPDWAFKSTGNKVDFSYYVKVCKNLNERLINEGLRDKVKLVLSDDTFNKDWLTKSVIELYEIADGFNSHCYVFGDENSYKEMYNWAAANNEIVDAFASKVPYTHNEFGGNKLLGAYHQGDIDQYERGVYYARLSNAFMNAGSNGMLHWEYFDMYYYSGDRDEAVMSLGLFQYVDKGWAVRPFYHSWGLIMKYTRPGSDVFPMVSDSDDVCATAYRTENGEWSYVVVNSDRANARSIRIDNVNADELKMNVHLYSRSTVTESDKVIEASSRAYEKDGSVYIEIPAYSFVMLTELR